MQKNLFALICMLALVLSPSCAKKSSDTTSPSVSAPGSFTISSVTSGTSQAVVSWGTSTDASTYTVKYGTSPGSYPTTASTSATSPYTVTGLSNGATYYFMVTAVNSGGSTDATASSSATLQFTFSFSSTSGANPLNSVATDDSSFPTVASFSSKLYTAWAESLSGTNQIRVKSSGSGSWPFVDTQATPDAAAGLNIDSTSDAGHPTLLTYGSKIYIAWVEDSGGTYKVRLNGSSNGTTWNTIDNQTGSGLNYDSGGAKDASFPTMAMLGSDLYIAWYEGTASPYQIRVKKYTTTSGAENAGGAVAADSGGATGINYDTLKNARNSYGSASLAASSVSGSQKLYAAWQEENASAKTQIRVKQNSTGTTWVSVDGGTATAGLNYDSAYNALHPRLVEFDSKLYVIWTENNATSTSQVRVKVYDGTSWSWADGGAATGINYNTAKAADRARFVVFNSRLYAVWSEMGSSVNQIRLKVLSGTNTWSSVDGNAATGLNSNTNKSANSPVGVEFNSALYLGWSEAATSVDNIRVSSGN